MTYRFPPLTPEVVRCSIEAQRVRLREQLARVVRLASADPSIGHLVFDVRPSFAADRFPLQAYAWTRDREEPGTTASNAILDVFDGNPPLLPSEFQWMPIGRDDIAGADFTPEARLIADALITEVRAVWRELRTSVDRPSRRDLCGYVSMEGFWADEGDGRQVLDLDTGEWELTRGR